MNFKNIIIRSSAPYPEIKDACDDRRTVAVLKNLANSRRGELFGILTYIYQSVISDKVNCDIASVLEEIAIVEMTHLHLLMHAISEFGGMPKYEDAQGNFFNTNCVNYSMKLHDMLNANIQTEKEAIDDYQNAMKMVSNQSLCDLFSRIIEDEKCHIEAFKFIRDNVEFMSI